MPKLTKEQLEIIKQKYEEYKNHEDLYLDVDDVIEEKFPNKTEIEKDNPNDPLFLEFCAMMPVIKQQSPSKYYTCCKNGQKYGIDSIDLLQALCSNIEKTDEIESIEDGQIVWGNKKEKEEGKERVKIDWEKITKGARAAAREEIQKTETEPEPERVNPENIVNQVFTDDFMEGMLADFKENEYFAEAINYENNPNNDIPLFQGIRNEVEKMNKNETELQKVQADAKQLLGFYEVLKERSEKRTFLDILKHPFRTFGEWRTRNALKEELQTRFKLTDSHLDAMDKMIRGDKAVPGDFKGFDRDLNSEEDLDDDDLSVDLEEEDVSKQDITIDADVKERDNLSKDDEKEIDGQMINIEKDTAMEKEVGEKSQFKTDDRQTEVTKNMDN